MSNPLNVQSLIDAGVPERAGNLCPDSPTFFRYINSFQERALSYGRWWGTTQLMQFCVTSKCVVLPRQVAVVEALTLNQLPLQPRNQWYSYVYPHRPYQGCGTAACNPGIYPTPCACGCGCGPFVSEDKLTVPSFQVTAAGQKIRFYPGNVADVGKTIIIQGYDSNGVWVRSTIEGVVQDGVQVTLASPFVTTAIAWAAGAPTAIIKEPTSYQVMMFSVDPDTGEDVNRLAVYEPSETLPSYRKLYLPTYRAGCGCSDGEGTSTLRAIVSLNHIPVTRPLDWLLFQSTSVYIDGVKSELLRDNNDLAGSDKAFFGADDVPRNGRGGLRSVKLGGALPTLQAELRKMTGDLTTVQVRRSGVNLAGFV